MDVYGLQAKYHMKKYGSTPEQIAYAAAKNHNNGALNPKAHYRFEMTPEQVLADREISWPFTRSMCASMTDGAAAIIICSEAYLKTQTQSVKDRAICIRAALFTGGKYRSVSEPSLTHIAANKAYQKTGINPNQIDVAEIHDASSFCEIYQSEMLGFCEIGEGGEFIASGATKIGGTIPINTSAGLVSKGHPIGATGLSMTFELVTQLRGDAGKRQVKDAAIALQENGGGIIGMEEGRIDGAIAAAILLGMIQAFGQQYFAGWIELGTNLFLVVILVFRPQGLFALTQERTG
uniref:Thiolase C-terminal domain-containing protein n=1 Tax=OCS116 cluster bacterium TaxID=2030921 RepID=A0A2A4Z6B4_9PROT